MESPTPAQAPFHILVVDDEPDLEPLLRQRLRRHVRKGIYALHFAGDGAEALESLRASPDIGMVVTDINMPRMDGLTLLGELATEAPDVKAVVVSAYDDMANIRTAMNRGAFDFVTKPLDFADFEITLERAHKHILQWREAQRSRDRLNALQRELDVASQMQQGILPVEFPRNASFDIHGEMTPARTVGGDFFDVLTLEHGRIGLAVADVSGKGIPAALFMMTSRTMLKSAAIGHEAAEDVVSEVNALLHAENTNFMFTTLFYAIYDPETGRVSYTNAGHCNPLVIGADGSAREVPGTNGVVLGLKGGIVYEALEAQLEPGETLVMYTDGISEAMNAGSEEFGVERLKEALGKCRLSSATEAVKSAMDEIEQFTRGAAQSDDITCLALHRSR